jgi:hypothetical protein
MRAPDSTRLGRSDKRSRPQCAPGHPPPFRVVVADHAGLWPRANPPSSRAADLFLPLEHPPGRSPDRYRKTLLTWEPPYGIEP